jgi:hypothetical protein
MERTVDCSRTRSQFAEAQAEHPVIRRSEDRWGHGMRLAYRRHEARFVAVAKIIVTSIEAFLATRASSQARSRRNGNCIIALSNASGLRQNITARDDRNDAIETPT